MTETTPLNATGNIVKAIWGTLTGLASAALYAYLQKKMGGEDVSFMVAYFGIMTIAFIGLPLYMVTLAKGAIAGCIAALTATAGLYAFGLTEQIPYYVVTSALPAALFGSAALLSRKDETGKLFWFPEGYLVSGITLYPAILFLGAVFAYRGEEGGLLGKTTVLFQTSWKQYLEKAPEEATASLAGIDMNLALEQAARFLPTTAALIWMSIAIISGLVAHKTIKKQGWSIRETLTLKDFVVPSWLLIAVAATGTLGYMGSGTTGYIGMNLSIMLCVPYFFNGLSLIHAFTANKRGGKFLLVIVYMFLMIPWMWILVTLLGTLDTGLGLKKRMKKPE